jgi:hypothetical protein
MEKERTMKPTITNAFLAAVGESEKAPASGSGAAAGRCGDHSQASGSPQPEQSDPVYSPLRAPSSATLFVPLQADVKGDVQFLVSMEQSAWSDGRDDAELCMIARRLGLAPLETIGTDQLVLDAGSLRALVAIVEPARLLVVAVSGSVDQRDARAMNKAIEATRSPLTAELRAVAALEVLGDRSVVLHCRERALAVNVVAENFRHYLAAILNRSPHAIASPDAAQIDHLLRISGALTVRPIETAVNGTSIDVGINTSLSRFSQPANLALVYDLPSNTWHME